ncbi:o-acyltransferase [Anaeramoeba ignava]|uniref:O-acyltransferase n=1 Tax=Anaeramoeba ignava TaxID=1746090 RepID=A0A9Q0R895_ANAIG|nr:o-acyltransferase [Anaeramoeba ignava]
MTNPQSFEILFFATGRNLPIDPGDYDMCNSLDNTHQCIIQFDLMMMGEQSTLEWGFCFPKSCNNEYAPNAVDLYLAEFFPFGQRIPSTTVVHCSDELTKKITAGTVITSIIAILFILFVIIASIKTYFVDQKKNQEKSQFSIQNNWEQSKEEKINDNIEYKDDIQFNEIEQNNKTKKTKISERIWKFLDCYSFQKNWAKLIQKSPVENTKFLNGMRVLSMFWIIFGHSTVFQFEPGFNNEIATFSKNGAATKWPFQIINGAEFGVDTFFFLSGFLIAFLSIPKAEKKKLNIGHSTVFQFEPGFNINEICNLFKNGAATKWSFQIVNGNIQIWRLIPSLAFVILIFTNISRFFGNGPYFFKYTDIVKETCSKYWYSSLFFFNNFYPTNYNDECLSWVWYLANDFQFHIITPIFIFLFIWKKIFGWISIFIMICLGCGMNFWLTHKYNINFFIGDPTTNDYMNHIYVKPYTRVLPYIIGVGCAMILISFYEKRKQNQINQNLDEKDRLINTKVYLKKSNLKTILFGYLIFIILFVMLVIVILLPYNNYKNEGKNWNINGNAAYIGLSKLFWGIGIGGIVIIFYNYTNIFPLIRKFLSLELWTPLGRLTYNAYLMHPVIMYLANLSSRILFNYNAVPIFYATTTNVVLSYSLSLVIFMLVERPFMNFERYICAKFHGSG